MWDLPGPGLEPVSPALAGGFLTTAPPGKPLCCSFCQEFFYLQALPSCVQASLLACDNPEGRERSFLLAPQSRREGWKDGLCLPANLGFPCPQGESPERRESPGSGGLLCHLGQVLPPSSGPSCTMGQMVKLRLGLGDLWRDRGGDGVWLSQQESI